MASPPNGVSEKWQGTDADRHDMLVIGRSQQLRRNFHLVSILGFGCVLISTWEIIITSFGIGLTNGGTAGLIYGFIIVTTGHSLVYSSLAEMASMSPTAGGQYHWVSEFSPRSCQKYLSYLSGWLCFTGWQAAIGAIASLVGFVIQGLIILHQPETYIYKRWHGTLLIIAIILIAFGFNTILARRLPLVHGLQLVVHACGAFILIITLLVLSPKRPARDVFAEFYNGGGWSTMGVSFMVGLTPITGSLAGIDSLVHMAEEVKDASRILPLAILTSLPLNASLGFIMIVTLCICTVDLDDIFSSPVGSAGYPFIQIIHNATGNLAATTVLVAIPLISLTGSVIAETATASRQLWAFARDGGIPLSPVIAKVHPRFIIPLNAIVVTLIINLLLPLINIGSTAALYAVFSLSGVSILSSYILCIGSLLIKRMSKEALPASRWSLARFGTALNIGSLCFLFPVAVFQFFPPTTPVTPTGMNWGSLMFGFMLIVSTTYYVLYGRKVYVPPVQRVRRNI